MAKKIEHNYDDLAKLAGIHFPGGNKQEEKNETEKIDEKEAETVINEKSGQKKNRETEKTVKEKKETPVEENVKDDGEQTFFQLIENLDFENKRSKLTFNKKQIYISDEVKELLDWMATISDKSLKSIIDITVLEFYKANREKINEEYKRYLKNQKPGLA